RTALGLLVIVLAAGCAAEPTTLLVNVQAPVGVILRTLTVEISVGGTAVAPVVLDRPSLPGTLVVQLVSSARQIDVALTAEDDGGRSLGATASVASRP